MLLANISEPQTLSVPAYTATRVGKMKKESSRDGSQRPLLLEKEKKYCDNWEKEEFFFVLFFKMGEIQICFYAKKSRERGCLKVQKREGVMTNAQDLSR